VCAACVAQGIVYVGGAVGSLRVMAARAEAKRTPKAGSGAKPSKLATPVPKESAQQA
jgi:hypothetical protein